MPGFEGGLLSGGPERLSGGPERLAELALVIADFCRGDPGFGATRLNKALFFSDHLHYKRHGCSITGAVYERLPRAPAPRGILGVREGLAARGDAAIEVRGYLGHEQTRLVPLRAANWDLFGPTELELTADVCESLRPHAHAGILAWQLAEEREEIIYPSAFLSSLTPTREDLARGLALADQRGLLGPGSGGHGGAGRLRRSTERSLRGVSFECSLAEMEARYPRAEDVLAGIVWACERWPDGIHRIPGTRLHLLKTQWPVPSLAAWFSLEGDARCTVWALEETQPYAPEEDGSD